MLTRTKVFSLTIDTLLVLMLAPGAPTAACAFCATTDK